jgi:hypothetical protein
VVVGFPRPPEFTTWEKASERATSEGSGPVHPATEDPTIEAAVPGVQDAVAEAWPATTEVRGTTSKFQATTVKDATPEESAAGMAKRRSTRVRQPKPKAAKQERTFPPPSPTPVCSLKGKVQGSTSPLPASSHPSPYGELFEVTTSDPPPSAPAAG